MIFVLLSKVKRITEGLSSSTVWVARVPLSTSETFSEMRKVVVELYDGKCLPLYPCCPQRCRVSPVSIRGFGLRASKKERGRERKRKGGG